MPLFQFTGPAVPPPQVSGFVCSHLTGEVPFILLPMSSTYDIHSSASATNILHHLPFRHHHRPSPHVSPRRLVLRRWRAGVRGRISTDRYRCHRPARQACSAYRTPGASVCGTWPPREGGPHVIVSYFMPWRSSFPCHRMCCGPDTLLWFALTVFRVADMIGIVGHVSFLPQKKKKKIIATLQDRSAWHGLVAPCFPH